MDNIEAEMVMMKKGMENQIEIIAVQKADLADQLNAELTKHMLMMNEIVEGAKKEFGGIQLTMKVLFDTSQQAVGGSCSGWRCWRRIPSGKGPRE